MEHRNFENNKSENKTFFEGVKKAVSTVTTPEFRRMYGIIKREGVEAYKYRKNNHDDSWNMYQEWIKQNDRLKEHLAYKKLEYCPLISVVVPVYNVKSNQLRECIDSVINQKYTNWELCLVDDASTMPSVAETLAEYENNEKIKIKYRKENGHISRTTNDGIAMATGEFVALLDCDDLLTQDALYEMALMLNDNRDYDFIYSDEDKIDEDGKERNNPFFKPDWSPDTFVSIMYTCHFSMFRKTLLDQLGGMRVGYEGSQDYDLVLRVMECTRNIGHIPKILYHWRTRKESTANDMAAKPYILESTVKAKEDAIARRGRTGRVEYIKDVCQYRVVYDVLNNPKVSIVIPSKDNYEVLKQCIVSLVTLTAYKNIEIIVVDNGSNTDNKAKYEKLCADNNCIYIYEEKKFNFSYMCNTGAKHATGEYVLFLNDDIEITQKDWLDRMLGQAQCEYTGAVGCKLVYPDSNLIQHTGVVNYEIGPGHCFHGFDDGLNCYFGRNILDYNYTVVTGACMLINMDKFREIGGFEEKLPVAYNDVELCFKLVEHGYYNVVRNDVKLVHHESVSRGYEDSAEKKKRLKSEMTFLYQLHPKFKGYDPCYNPNLVQDKGDFSFNVKMVKDIALLDSELSDKYTNLETIEAHNSGVDSSIDSGIENIKIDDEYIQISGWAYNEKVKNNRKYDLIIALRNSNGDTKCFKVGRKFRPDISRLYGKKGNKAFCGFDTYIVRDKIKEGKYKVYFIIGDCVIDSKSNVEL